MSRTYNTPPPVFMTKLRGLGRALGNETKMMISWPLAALKMGLESMLRFERISIIEDRPQQFLGIGSITQELLDNAERNRRCGLPADPFKILAGHPAAALDHDRRAPTPTVKKFHAARHTQH